MMIMISMVQVWLNWKLWMVFQRIMLMLLVLIILIMVVECMLDLKWYSEQEIYSGRICGMILKMIFCRVLVLVVWMFLIGLGLIVLIVLVKSLVSILVVLMNSVSMLVNGFRLMVIMKSMVKIILLIEWQVFIICCIGWQIYQGMMFLEVRIDSGMVQMIVSIVFQRVICMVISILLRQSFQLLKFGGKKLVVKVVMLLVLWNSMVGFIFVFFQDQVRMVRNRFQLIRCFQDGLLVVVVVVVVFRVFILGILIVVLVNWVGCGVGCVWGGLVGVGGGFLFVFGYVFFQFGQFFVEGFQFGGFFFGVEVGVVCYVGVLFEQFELVDWQ